MPRSVGRGRAPDACMPPGSECEMAKSSAVARRCQRRFRTGSKDQRTKHPTDHRKEPDPRVALSELEIRKGPYHFRSRQPAKNTSCDSEGGGRMSLRGKEHKRNGDRSKRRRPRPLK